MAITLITIVRRATEYRRFCRSFGLKYEGRVDTCPVRQ
jgi:hypothetical protein